MKRTTRFIAIVLATLILLSTMTGCMKIEPVETTLRVACSSLNGKFSPFFAETAYDKEVQSLTQALLLTSDRVGAVVLDGIEGETSKYNGTDYTYYGVSDLSITENEDGTVYYDFTLREDMKFSDGEEVTVDDVIFSMYVFCDPTYNGTATLVAQPILGLDEYLAGMKTLFELITEAGRDNTDFTYWNEQQQKALWEDLDAAGVEFIRTIVEYHMENSGATDVASAAELCGYELPAGSTQNDFWNAMVEKYEGDYISLSKKEMKTQSLLDIMENYADYAYGVKTGDSSEKIKGIEKTGDHSLRVTMTKLDASSVYQLAIPVAPLHYYGDEANYDYEAGKFGFTKGDLSSIRDKNAVPVGAGPYKFVKFENGVVSFEANENYYLGVPKTKYVNFIVTKDEYKISGVTEDAIDVSVPDFDIDAVNSMLEANQGSLNGDVLNVKTVDKLGYGYIGINANAVSVGGEGSSEASKNLRRAFATLFSVYRDLAVDSYYGERAAVINYPISNTSWAAPSPSDEGYKVAFSESIDGAALYTEDMTEDAKYSKALEAALGFFAAAGYTVENGKITAAPEGAKLEYEMLIPGDGKQEHPVYLLAVKVSEVLSDVGMKLIVTDLTDSADLWTALEATNCEMWCAGWNATADPDMYQMYFSGDDIMPAGGSNYMYGINDSKLNELIIDARGTTDKVIRKSMYKDCLDIILDWAVEVPVYQRQDAVVFSASRIKMNTVTPDITPFYGWMSEIHNIEVFPNK